MKCDIVAFHGGDPPTLLRGVENSKIRQSLNNSMLSGDYLFVLYVEKVHGVTDQPRWFKWEMAHGMTLIRVPILPAFVPKEYQAWITLLI